MLRNGFCTTKDREPFAVFAPFLQLKELEVFHSENKVTSMNASKSAVWIFALANTVVALTGLLLDYCFESIFYCTMEGGHDALPIVTKIYISHEIWIFAAFSVPLAFAALILTLRNNISSSTALLFGAVSVLVISCQILTAVVAIAFPYIPVLIHFEGESSSENLPRRRA